MPSDTTDTRVVQMQFDNNSFERDISQSEKSLDRFKEALDFSKAEKSLDDFSDATKRLTFESMAENIQKLTDKFTGLGTVSEFILGQVRQSLEKAAYQAKSFFDSLTTQQIGAGMDKFGQLNKNVQTIKAATGKSEEDVYRVLSRLNEYTDQTSYNFTDMAANIGKFTSVGIDLESAEKQMEGIANWAARSGGGIGEASRAMYNLSQAMGVGALTKMDWKSIENAGMATKEFKEQLIQAGVESGNLEKSVGKNGETTYKTAKKFGTQTEVTYQNLSETLSKKWVDTTVMQKTFLSYYFDDLYYEREDVLKKALNDGTVSKADWGDFKTKNVATEEFKQNVMDAAVEVGNLTKETTKDGKVVYKTAKKYGEQIEVTLDNFEESLERGWFDKGVKEQTDALADLAESSYESAQKCTTLTDVFEAWKDQISTGWMTSFKHIFGELTESMELFSNICNKVGTAFDELIQYRNKILERWGNTGGRENLWSLFVGEVEDEGEVVAYKGAYGFLDVLGDIGKLISTGYHNLIKMIAGKDVARLIEKDGEEWEQAFLSFKINQIITTIRDFITSIHDFFNATAKGSDKSRWDQIQDVVDAIYSAFLIAYTVIRDVAEFFGKLFDENHLGKSVDSILEVFSALGIGITKTAESAKDGNGLKVLLDNLLISIEPLIEAVNQLVASLSSSFIAFIQNGTEAGAFTGIWQTIVDIISLLGRIFSKVGVPILNFIKTFLEIVVDLFEGEFTPEKFSSLSTRLFEAVTKLVDDLFGLIPGFGKDIQSFIAYLFGFAEDYTGEEADASSHTITGVFGKWIQKIFGIGESTIEGFKKDADQFNLFTWVKTRLGIDNFGNFINQVGGMVKGTNLYGIIMAFLGGNALLQLIKLLKNGREVTNGISDFLAGASDTLKEGLKIKVGEETEGFVDKFQVIAKSITMIAASIAVLGSMSLPSLLKGLGVIAVAMLGIFGFIKLLETKVKSDPKKLKGLIGMIASAALLIFGISIGFSILLAAIRPMANMKMEQVITMLTGFMGVVLIVGLFAKYVTSSMKGVNFKGMLSMALLGIAIGILIKSLLPLTTLNQGQLLQMAEGLLGVLLILSLFAKYANNFKFKGVISVAGLAISIGILILALMPLANLSNDQLLKMAEGLTGTLLILAVFAKYANNFKFKGILSIIGLAGSIAILIFALMPLAEYSWEQLGKMGAGLAAIMLILGAFVNETASMKGTGMFNVVLLAGAIWVLVKALEPLANYEWEQLLKMGVGLAFIVTVITVMTNKLGEINIAQGVSSLLMMVGLALVIGVFGLAMGSASNLRWDQMVTACLGLIAVIAAFGIIQKRMLSNSDILDSVTSLIMLAGLAVVMIAFSVALNEIRDIPVDKVLVFAIGLSALLLALGGSLKLLSGVGLVSGIKGIVLLSAGLAAIIAVIAALAPMLAGSIGTAMTTISSHLTLFGNMMGTFSSRMDNVEESNIEKAKRIITLISGVLTNMASYFVGAASAQSFTDSMASLLTASGLMKDFSVRMNSVTIASATKLGDFAKEIKKSLNEVKDFASYQTDINSFTTALFDLGTSAQIFTQHTGDVEISDLDDNPALKLIKDLSACASDMDTISKMNLTEFTGNISGLGGAMMLYAQGAKEATGLDFGGEEGTDVPDVSAAVALLTSISSALAENGGFTIPDNMPDETALGSFGAQLAALAAALVKFEQAGAGLGDGTEQALKTLTFFKDLKNKLVEIDFKKAVVDTLNQIKSDDGSMVTTPGELETFGKNIEQLGLALAAFAKSTTIIDEATGEITPIDYTKATEALTSFAELESKLPKITLIDAWLKINQPNLTTLASEIQELGQALKDFALKVTGKAEGDYKGLASEVIDEGKTASGLVVDKAVEVANKIIEIRGKLPKSWDITSIWDGKPISFTAFSGEITALGTALNEFSMSVSGANSTDPNYKGFDEKSATASLSIMDSLVTIASGVATRLPQVGGVTGILKSLFGGRDSNLSDLSDQIKSLGEGLGSFASSISGKFTNTEEAISAIGVLGDLIEMVAGISTIIEYQGLGSYIDFISKFLKSLTSTTNEVTGVQNETSAIEMIVNMMGLISDLVSKNGNINKGNLEIFGTLASALRDITAVDLYQISDQFKDVGENIANGAKAGIEKGTSGVIDAAVNMAISAYKAAKAALDVNSPSKKFMEIGLFGAEGFADGFINGSDHVASAGEDVANTMIETTSGLLGNLSYLLTNDIDADPVITPVLDLTNVTKGAEQLNALLGNDRTIGIDASGANVSANMANPNKEVIDALQNRVDLTGIQNQITNLQTAINNVNTTVGNLKIYLNTNVIAGAVTDDVDRGIGRNMLYASRNN